MNIRGNRGITLTTLVVTIIVLLILAGVATSTGIEAIENTKHTKFVAELKIMQSYVNQWYEDCKPSINSTTYDETFNSNIQTKFTAINAKNATEDEQAQTTLNQANILTDDYSNFYILEDEQKSALGVEGVSQKVLVSIKNRKVVSYDGLKWKNNMYYTIDDQSGEGLGEIYNVEYQNPNTNAPTIEVTGKSVYYGDTAKNAKYRFTVNVTQGSSYINKGDLYYGKKENGNVRNWQKTANNTLLVDREGTYQFYYKDAAGNVSNVFEYVIEPKATLIDGIEFNKTMKTLSGTNDATYSTANTNIIQFKMSNIKPIDDIIENPNNLISISNSVYPVYMWFDNGVIWIWSEDNWIYTNSNCHSMFRNFKNITNIDLYFFDTNDTTTMTTMFNNCSNLSKLDLSTFNTSKVTTMESMFYGCSNLKDLDLSSFNTSSVTKMPSMFYGCSNLKDLDLSNFNTSNVNKMNSMFYNCLKLVKLNLSNFNTSKVTDMSSMFYNCNGITEINVNNFDTSSVENMSNMFNNCTSLTELDLSSFNTSNVTNMLSMFSRCTKIQKLNIYNFNTSNVNDMQTMFFGCYVLTTIYVKDSFEVNEGTNTTNMFNGCSALEGGNGTKYSVALITDGSYAHIDGGPSNPGYFTKKE